jgi:two-component system OmpR family sensor kinase
MDNRAWSMNRRILAFVTSIVGLLWIAGVSASALLMRHEIDEVFDSALQETAQRILPLAVDDLGERREQMADRRLDRHREGDHEEYILYQVRDASGRVLLRSHDAPEQAFAAPLTRGYFDDGTRRYFTEWSADKSLAIQVAELPKERREAVQALWIGLLAPLLIILPLAAFGTHLIVRRTTSPIKKLQAELTLRDGSNLASIDGAGLPSELMPVISDVNRLLFRLNAALEAERSFASNSAHELRNPLAAAQAQATLLAGSLQDAEQGRRADAIVATLSKLSRRVETLLQLARAESGMALAREVTSLRDIVGLIVSDLERKPGNKDRLSLDNLGDSSLLVHANTDALGIAIQNLIGNSLKHSPAGSRVTITLGAGPTLSIVNRGSIVPASDLAHLKERFARASNGAQEGSGLGLYIADTIARQSGARLELYSPARSTDDGFEAVLSW